MANGSQTLAENQNEKYKVKSPCVGNFTIKEIVAFAIVVLTLLFNGALVYYQIKDLPEKVSKNTNDITNLKTDISEMKPTIQFTYDDVREIKKHLMRKK